MPGGGMQQQPQPQPQQKHVWALIVKPLASSNYASRRRVQYIGGSSAIRIELSRQPADVTPHLLNLAATRWTSETAYGERSYPECRRSETRSDVSTVLSGKRIEVSVTGPLGDTTD
jgi:hypothetical protein